MKRRAHSPAVFVERAEAVLSAQLASAASPPIVAEAPELSGERRPSRPRFVSTWKPHSSHAHVLPPVAHFKDRGNNLTRLASLFAQSAIQLSENHTHDA
jgi:hypothetical protein